MTTSRLESRLRPGVREGSLILNRDSVPITDLELYNCTFGKGGSLTTWFFRPEVYLFLFSKCLSPRLGFHLLFVWPKGRRQRSGEEDRKPTPVLDKKKLLRKKRIRSNSIKDLNVVCYD